MERITLDEELIQTAISVAKTFWRYTHKQSLKFSLHAHTEEEDSGNGVSAERIRVGK